MSPQPRMLVPLDLEETSRQILRYALDLGERMRAKIDVLHVWEPPHFARPDLMVYLESEGRSVSLAEYSRAQAHASLEKLLTEVVPEGTQVAHALVEGWPAHEIVAKAQAEGHDLIVLGTRGRTGLPRLLIGSVAEKVVRMAPCPVVVVPAAPAP